MSHNAYWINKRGKILDIGLGTHIDQVIKSPQSFGLTDRYVKNTYEKYGEPVGQEGKAREQIMLELIRDGFIRIRFVKNQFWIINAHKWTPQVKKALSVWAEVAKEVRGAGKFMPVKIVTNFETVNQYDVNDIYYEKHLNESDIKKTKRFLPCIVESVSDFKYNEYENLITLVEGK